MDTQNQILDDDFIEKNSNAQVHEIVNLNKFIFLSLISFGLYQIWWAFKAWQFYQEKEKLDIVPLARALFSIFYLNSLFSKILETAQEKGYSENYSSTLLFVVYVIGSLCSRMPEPYWLISLITLFVFIPPVKALNFAKQNSNDIIANEQTSFNSKQILVVVLGATLWVFTLLGLFYTE